MILIVTTFPWAADTHGSHSPKVTAPSCSTAPSASSGSRPIELLLLRPDRKRCDHNVPEAHRVAVILQAHVALAGPSALKIRNNVFTIQPHVVRLADDLYHEGVPRIGEAGSFEATLLAPWM